MDRLEGVDYLIRRSIPQQTLGKIDEGVDLPACCRLPERNGVHREGG